MRRINVFINGLIEEKDCSSLGNIICTGFCCATCPTKGRERCVEKLGEWLMEEVQTETYTERIITGYIYYTANGKSCNSCDNLTEDAVVQYTYIIRTEEDERNAKEKEQGLRLCGYKVKVQNFIHEKTETLPWDKE